MNDYADSLSPYTRHQIAGGLDITLKSDGTPAYGSLDKPVTKDDTSAGTTKKVDGES